jgi:hypothetical protein
MRAIKSPSTFHMLSIGRDLVSTYYVHSVSYFQIESDRNETFMRHLSDRYETIRDGRKKNHKRRANTTSNID